MMILKNLFQLIELLSVNDGDTSAKDNLFKEYLPCVETLLKMTPAELTALTIYATKGTLEPQVDAPLFNLVENGCLVEKGHGDGSTTMIITPFGERVHRLRRAESQLQDWLTKDVLRTYWTTYSKMLVTGRIEDRTKEMVHGLITEAANIRSSIVALYAVKTGVFERMSFPSEYVSNLLQLGYVSKTDAGLEITKRGKLQLDHMLNNARTKTTFEMWTTSIMYYSDQNNSVYYQLDLLMGKNKPLDPFYSDLFKRYGFLNRKGFPTRAASIIYGQVRDKMCQG